MLGGLAGGRQGAYTPTHSDAQRLLPSLPQPGPRADGVAQQLLQRSSAAASPRVVICSSISCSPGLGRYTIYGSHTRGVDGRHSSQSPAVRRLGRRQQACKAGAAGAAPAQRTRLACVLLPRGLLRRQLDLGEGACADGDAQLVDFRHLGILAQLAPVPASTIGLAAAAR